MAVLPQQDSGPPQSPHPLPKLGRIGAALVLSGAGLALLAWGGDQALRRLYQHWQPRLEQSLGEVLGHPLELGPYQGLAWAGLRLGPSRIGAGPTDASSVAVRSVAVSLDPLASLCLRLPVLHVTLAGVRADLRRNRQGQYWVPGRLAPGVSPPRLDLRLRLADPALVTLAQGGQSFRLAARLGLRPHRRSLELDGRLRPARGGGQMALRLEGNWQERRWQANLRSQAFPLAALQGPLPVPGQLSGRLDGRVGLSLRGAQRSCQGQLQLGQIQWRPGPGGTRLELAAAPLRCQGQRLDLARSNWRWAGPGALKLQGTVEATGLVEAGGLALTQLELRRGASWVRLGGRLNQRLDLRGRWRLSPRDLPLQAGRPVWLLDQLLDGSLEARGPWRQPELQARFGQSENPLLGPWSASLDWRQGRLALQQFSNAYLRARGVLPLALRQGKGLVPGPLDLQLDLQRYPLSRLGLLVGSPLQGVLGASGRVRGPLSALTPDLDLRIDQPGAGPISLRETWQGQWFGDRAGGGRLAMEALAPALSGELVARFDSRWVPRQVRLERDGGWLELVGRPRGYRWQASGLSLEGLQLALGPRGRRQPLQGQLSGQGQLELQPLAFSGDVSLDRPVFLGVWGKTAQATFRYRDRRYQAQAALSPLAGGQLELDWSGLWNGPFRSRLEGRQLSTVFLQQLGRAWPQWRGEGPPRVGRASDIGTLLIDTFGGTLGDHLQALNLARQRLALDRAERERLRTPLEKLQRLAGSVDLDLGLEGPTLLAARADLDARAHLWSAGTDRDQALTQQPLQARFQGPLRQGTGSFSLANLPLELLALLTPVPAGLGGLASARGSYSLGGSRPELSLNLALEDARLLQTPLDLERGLIELQQGRLLVDLSLRAAGAASSVDLAGTVPLDPRQEGVELRLASRDDGLRFLTGLAQPALEWKEGSGDLQLLVRGSVAEPIANGFLRLRGGQLQFIGQRLQEVEAIVLFDFEQLELQQFSARVGEKGSVRGSGSLGLLRPGKMTDGQEASLAVELTAVPFSMPRIRAVAAGQLRIGGSLNAMDIGGELSIARGNINVQPGRLASEKAQGVSVASVPELIESSWNFQQPLVLLGPEVESDASGLLRASVPNVRFVGFDNLRLSLGPDLTVGVPNLASFNSSGLLRINGRLDPSLRLQGVVRLLRGRLNLFTSTFGLDPDSPNVAVFTPSMGLIPYLDISLRTRVSDSLPVASGIGTADSLSLQNYQAEGGTNSLDQLNLVRVYLSVSGPADRLADNLVLRSSPPLSQDRLLALIGGNTLAGLAGGAGTAVLATALGQTLLSPLLGSFSDVLGERLSFALYPTYVNQAVNSGAERRSGRVPPQLVLGAEIGLDIDERFNASVLAAPNRSDVPPQLNLNYRASELLNLQGSVDSQGAWQTQLQLFFRF